MANKLWTKLPIADQFMRTREANAPLLAISTPDAAATISQIATLFDKSKLVGLIIWDAVSGARGLNAAGEKYLKQACGDMAPNACTINPIEFCDVMGNLKTDPDKEQDVIVFAHNLHQYMLGGVDASASAATVTQAVWNLRDKFKKLMSTFVILGASFNFPASIAPSFVILDEPLPDEALLRSLISALVETNREVFQTVPTETEMAAMIEALRGLPRFVAEQALALNVEGGAINQSGLWETKRQMVAQVRGLSIYDGDANFDRIGGCEGVKDFMHSVMTGKNAPRAIVRFDELEKAMAGSSSGGPGDSSGVSQGILGSLLTYMADNDTTGLLFVGHPGVAKSEIAKASGAVTGVPVIDFDLNGMKSSLVGSTEEAVRAALKIITAITGGKVLFIATCNNIKALPPELKRRFSLGRFMFELPTAAERESIWTIWKGKYGLTDDHSAIDATNWTGDEIRRACDIAYRLGIDLAKAATKIVPVALSDADRINALREEAHNRYLSATTGEVFTADDLVAPTTVETVTTSGRSLRRSSAS